MTPVLVMEGFSGFVLVVCLAFLFLLIRRNTGYGTSLAIVGIIIAIKSFVVLGNLLEHGYGIVGPDRIEEYLEITLPLFYFLFVVSYSLQDSHRTIERQKARLEKWNEDLATEVAKKAAELKKSYSELADARIALMNRNRAASFDRVIRKISHLINTPLGICITSATSLAGDGSDTSDETLGLLRRSLGRIVGLTTEIRRVLDLRTEEEKSRFLLSSLVDEAAVEIMGQTSVAFGYSVRGDDRLLFGYRKNLKKIFRELMTNSVIHNIGNPKLSIEVEYFVRGDRAVLRFLDNGKGIPAEFTDKVFDPFVTPRLSDARLGLGLFVVRSIVQNVFNGTVFVINREEGAGFEVTVPALEFAFDFLPMSGAIGLEI